MQKNYALWQAEQSFDASELERIDFSSLERTEDEGMDSGELEEKDLSLPAEVA